MSTTPSQGSIDFRKKIVGNYFDTSKKLNLVRLYKEFFLNLAEIIDDQELHCYVIEQLLIGLLNTKIEPFAINISQETLSDQVIAVCVVHNSEDLVDMFINHYLEIGVNHFAFIDNNSDDNTLKVMRKYLDRKNVMIDIWTTSDKFDGYKAMSWKQQLFCYYGLDRWYLSLDIDELFDFCSKNHNIYDLINYASKNNFKVFGAMLLDMYPRSFLQINKRSKINIKEEYRYFDYRSYKIEPVNSQIDRIHGGPRTRIFNRHPSLQKYPLAYISKDIYAINPHFWYPYSFQSSSKIVSVLRHYKFLPGDLGKYSRYVKTKVHWNNSSQYMTYVKLFKKKIGVKFYSDIFSAEYTNPESILRITSSNNKKILKKIY